MTSKNTIKKRKEQGICIYCGVNQSNSSGYICQSCREKSTQNAAKRRTKFKICGLCIKCGKNKPSGDHVKCDNCLISQSVAQLKLSADRRKQGLCINCNTISVSGNRFCEVCYLKHTASKHTSSVNNWQELKKLFELQDSKCVYTGKQLILGKNTDLDHITPISAGGKNSIDNFQWTLSDVNKMKWNKEESEFLELVKSIYEYGGKLPTQEHIMGCGLACVAIIAKKSYQDIFSQIKLQEKAHTTGFFGNELKKILFQFGYEYTGSEKQLETYENGTIIFIKNNVYLLGHWMVKTENGWFNSWINFPHILPAKSGFQNVIDGQISYVLFPNKR